MTSKIATATAVLAIVLMTAAQAQQRTIYGANGRVSGQVVTGSNGSTTIYDSSGRVSGRTSTGSNGTVTVYGADGRRVGTVSPDRRTKP